MTSATQTPPHVFILNLKWNDTSMFVQYVNTNNGSECLNNKTIKTIIVLELQGCTTFKLTDHLSLRSIILKSKVGSILMVILNLFFLTKLFSWTVLYFLQEHFQSPTISVKSKTTI